MGFITIDYRDRKLIYEQIVDNVKAAILRGDLRRDDHLPSVRVLARELGINPNTIQKAYAELERQGVIASLSGRGSIVVFDKDSVTESGLGDLKAELMPLIARARALGMTSEAFTEMASACWRADEHNKIIGGEEYDKN